ncbi:MAG: oxygen-independent coproporphyrinogen III oxidase [Fluviicoccus sp.]|uniref:oxygen-independent coproporphyrinogen III oxidase n=1 Tax=Fluviicoccus sp. TaxID=2003552 RepID=UPI002718CB21|nr:oxygen-independent coproporphyrinogen III oxidase [Fluviicoccus sp.]MDO8330800.1 oxygen-independent coproporphyrinogen III oxidase [Fluviicoccus sp.]
MNNALVFDPELLQRYDLSGPRYTSYPTAVQFHEGFGEDAYREAIAVSNAAARPLSLYVHLPFCGTVCYYCACNKIITANRKRASPYLEDLHREIELQAELFTPGREVRQLHWGGGTPTFISDEEMTALMNQLRGQFTFLDNDEGDYSIEIDPREVTPAKIAHLRKLGFNRMSFGVQDFDPKVQEAVNRIQSVRETFEAVDAARTNGFKSINIDLIYGLPFQTVDSFAVTLEKILELSPDRLSVFNYAHMPHLFKVQKQMDEATLPTPAVKLAILQYVIEKLTSEGYVYIGMDHFAKPDDELALAQEHGTLYRNFQGYSTHAGCDLVAMGITSIGMVDDTYSQNVKTLEEYHERVSAGQLPVYRGVKLTEDDKLRRAIITELICHFRVDMAAMGHAWSISFEDYFCKEQEQLQGMAADGLLSLNDGHIQVLPRGRLLIRNICMVFDAYLQGAEAKKRFSRVI